MTETEKTTSQKSEKLTAVKGMNDILPTESYQWEWLEGRIREVMARYAYQNIRTPIVEHTGLFERGTGQTTDIVEKEMYAFTDRMNGDQLCLRPENTPGVVRAGIEHNLTYNAAQRLYYIGPMFRHERPQRGRYRQFHQLGAEALGFAGPEMDAEMMVMVYAIFAELGLKDIRVEMNSLGVPQERCSHREALIAYFEKHTDLLDDDAKRRLHSNPLRILDSKNPAMQSMLEEAPKLVDYLGAASKAHLQSVQTLLTACGVPWSMNPRLVRGLDYYSHTVFEFITDQLGAQGTVCGGGRYDGLFEILGGKPTPAVGWALGMERLLDLLKTQNLLPQQPVPDAYAVVTDAAFLPDVMPILQTLRAMGVKVIMAASTENNWPSMKSQLKKADNSGARFALIIGEEEMASKQISLKDLRNNGLQRKYGMADIAQWAEQLKV